MFLKKLLAHQQGEYKPDFTINGSPTITDEGMVSGFSTSNYLLTPKAFDASAADSWEVGMKITTGSSVSGAYDFFGCAKSEGNALGMLVYNGKWLFSVGYNGSWISSSSGENEVLANTTYWIKMQFTGTNYIFSFSTDGQVWIEDKNVASTTKMTAGSEARIGRSSQWLNRAFNGTIDLKECYIKINGAVWWGNQYVQDVYAYQGYAVTAKKPVYYKYVDWVQPVFTSNTTWGEVSADSNSGGYGQYEYKALDGQVSGTDGADFAAGNSSITVNWYWKFAQKLKITKIDIWNRNNAGNYGGATVYTIYALNEDQSYTEIGQISLGAVGWEHGSLTVSEPLVCWGLKIYCAGEKSYVGIGELNLTAQERQESASSDYDEVEMVNKYYSICAQKPVAFYAWYAAEIDEYIYSKTLDVSELTDKSSFFYTPNEKARVSENAGSGDGYALYDGTNIVYQAGPSGYQMVRAESADAYEYQKVFY